MNVIDAESKEFDKENLSMKEVFDGLIDIAQKEFQVQTDTNTTETTATTENTQQTEQAQATTTDNGGYIDNSGSVGGAYAGDYSAPVGGNGGYSGANGYSGSFDNQGNFTVKTTDITKMTKAELTQELQQAETTANDKKTKLLCFFMSCMFFAEFAVFFHFNSVWIILFVFVRIIVSLFAFCACKSNSVSHNNYLF